jgi:radical SAM superfamily enzyme YgiQ (UPF0313 family)
MKVEIDYFINSDEKIKDRYSIKGYNNKARDWDESKTKVVMVSMSPMNEVVAEVGTIGTSILYNVINKREDALCERSSFPENKVLNLLKKYDNEMFSFESKHTMKSFDIIACSFYFSLQFVNLCPFLHLNKIPYFAKNRGKEFPLIIAGGQACYNPEPIAEFVDVVCIGEGEEWFKDLIDLWPAIKDMERHEQLVAIAQIKGSYIPSFYEHTYDGDKIKAITKTEPRAPDKVKRRWVKNITEYVMSGDDFVNSRNRGTIEIARGCGYMCSFCQLAHTMKPRRCLNLEEAKKKVDSFVGKKDTIKLFAPEEGSYPDYVELSNYMIAKGFEINSCDCRADCYTTEWGEMIVKGGADHISVGVEGFSQRERNFLNKCVTEENILFVCTDVFKKNLKAIKLFFISGLPEMDYDDVEEFGILMEKILKIRNELGANTQIDLSITLINTQPFTPMQWFGCESLDYFENFLDTHTELREYVKKHGHKDDYWDTRTLAYKIIKLKRTYGGFSGCKNMRARTTRITYLIGRGDRRLSKVMLAMSKFGVTFDGQLAKVRERIYALCDIYKVPYKRYQAEWDVNDVLPWDIIDVDIGKDMKKYLQKEFLRMKKEVDRRVPHLKVAEEAKKPFTLDNPNFVIDNFNRDWYKTEEDENGV